MAWIRNPFWTADQRAGPDQHGRVSESEHRILGDAERGNASEDEPHSPVDGGPKAKVQREPTDKFSTHQLLYLILMHGIGAMIISGGINFAIGYGMYTTQDIQAHPIRLFQLPNTLAGDAAVTIIVQNIVTWLIERIIVSSDLRNGMIAPVGFITPPENRLARWFLFLDGQRGAAVPGPWRHWPVFLVSQALRGFIFAVASFVLLWGPSVGILTAVGTRSGGDWVFEPKWAPEVFKLILGGLLALLATPPMALFWMVRAGWPAEETTVEESSS